METGILDRISELSNRFHQIDGQRKTYERSLSQHQKEVMGLEDKRSDLDKVAALFRQLIDQEILDSVSAAESLLTEGLQSVFDDQNIKVKAEVEVKHGKVSVRFNTVQTNSDGVVIEGLARDSFGGSVLAVQSVILRILLVFKHGLHPILFLDETLPAFDHNYVLNMAQFLKRLCRDMGLNILMVTHNPLLRDSADTAYEMRRGKSSSKTVLVRSNED
ncbi:MAG: hypothetical protein AAGM67_00365 [Bacteroidota bacterium]